MRTSERRQLKQDKFTETTKETISWAVEHRTVLIWALTVVIILAATALGGWAYWNHRNQQANVALGKALETYHAPLLPPNTPPSGNEISFPTALERSRAAHKQFQEIGDRYGHTKSGQVARYLAALTEVELGDVKGGEQELKKVADSGDQDLSSLAKLALAGLYRSDHRDKDALELYQDLVAHPSDSVSKPLAQLELASFYEATKQNADATRVYQEIVKDNPSGTAASLARQRMNQK